MWHKLKTLSKSDNAQVLVGNLSASAFGLMTFMLLARVLTKPEFGEWTLFVSTAGLFDLMRTGLVRQALVRFISIEKNTEKQQDLLASAGAITLFSSIGVAVLLLLISLFFDTSKWSLEYFFQYFPLLILITVPTNLDTWKSHAFGHFKRMNAIRLYINILFVAAIGVGSILDFTLLHFILLYLFSNLLVSVYSMLTSLSSVQWFTATKESMNSLFDFGKHSLATMTGANLLKSADSLIIGATLGTEAVAIYAVPLKALDLLEIPLRGFVMTAFRKLSRLFADGAIADFNAYLKKSIIQLTLIFLPGGLFMLAFPGLVTKILGGEGFAESNGLLMIFVIPMLLLPLDKFLGISFDSIGKPKINAIKVWIMVISNVLGDFLVIYWIGSLWAVAVVTIANIVLGIIFGLWSHPLIGMRQAKPMAIIS